MPAITGRVCHHPCEDSCNRASLDEAGAMLRLNPPEDGDRVVDVPEIERVVENVEHRVDVWLVTHPGLRRSARIRAVYDFLGERLEFITCRDIGPRDGDTGRPAR